MSTCFSRAKLMTPRFLVCVNSARLVLNSRILFCRLYMFKEIKKTLGENLALYPPREMARADLFRRCTIHHFWFHIFFLEIQVTGE